MGCVAMKMQRARREHAAAAAIDRLGGDVSWSSADSSEESAGRDWLRSLLGDGFFTHPDSVLIDSEAALEYLADLTHVRSLRLDGSQITDAGLEHLKGLPLLWNLGLQGTQLNDDGLEHVRELTQVRSLYLDAPQVTDASVEHLKGLTQLEDLILFRTQISDTGVGILQQALPHCDVHQIEDVECFP
jgi:hypothetical protein